MLNDQSELTHAALSNGQFIEKLLKIIDTQAVLGSAEFDLDQFMQIVVSNMQELTRASGAIIELIEGDSLVYKAACGTAAPFVNLRVLRSQSLSGQCARDREIKICDDTSTDNRVDKNACQKVGAASMICVPLARGTEVVGVLKVVSDQKHQFNQTDVQTLRLMAGLLGGTLGQQIEISKRLELEHSLRYQSHHDGLTGLPNRTLFYDRLGHAIRRSVRNKCALALLYMDIDHFKSVNDTHGHLVGDLLLKQFSERIQNVLRASDTFSRLGGDEFTVILEDINDSKQVDTVAEKIVKAAKEEFDLGDRKLLVSSSVGVALSENACVDPDYLIKLADSALYAAKKSGRACYAYSEVSIYGF